MKKQNTLYILLLFFLGSYSAVSCRAPVQDEKPIVIIIPSYNNSRWCTYNLASVFVQKYHNYRVIYIDDCSSDGTYQQVMDFVKKFEQQDRVKVINNAERRGALANLYYAIHSCDDWEIIVTLDGDDWFKHDCVLQRINCAYDDATTWMTYGQFENYPSGKYGQCAEIPAEVVQNRSYRAYDQWVTTHLRTFYSWLFKLVNVGDLKVEGKFFPVTWDMAFIFPMLEMATGHFKFIPEVLYVYNQANPLNDFRVNLRKQLLCEQFIRRKRSYQKLDEEEIKQIYGTPSYQSTP